MQDFTQFDVAFAYKAALLAQRAYLPNPCEGQTSDCAAFNASGIGASYFVQDMGEFAVVVFRGSQSVNDFIQDAKFIEVTVDGVGVHQGFWKDVEAVTKQVTLDLTAIGKPFVCIGHSLGADCAILFGWQAVKHLQGLTWLGTYALAPARPGNELWKEDYNKLCGDRTWCIVNEDDPVPWLPPVIMGAKRGGQLAFLLDENLEIDINPSALAELRYNVEDLYDKLELLSHHAIAEYVANLKARFDLIAKG